MSGRPALDATVMAVSFFNTLLLLWLGLTVLLNAERRTKGIWLAGGGLLSGAAFLIVHSAILGEGITRVSRAMNLWWHMGWLLAVALPFFWYLIILWYAGFWAECDTALRRRHQMWLAMGAFWALGLVDLLIFANPFPSYDQVVLLRLAQTPSIAGIPLLGLLYPLYVVICISLSLDVLWRPGPTGRMMGELARRRARPWLVATALALLAVSGLVAWVVLWVLLNARGRASAGWYAPMDRTLAWFDLVIDSLIALAVLLLGQAIVSYEIFTGKMLPRRGLRHQWRIVTLLTAGLSIVAGGSLLAQVRPVYGLLLATSLVALFYALLSRQSYGERERYIEHLRPFVASLGLYEHLLTRSASDVDVATPFRALCADVLGARAGYLVALGPLAALAGPPLAYPEGSTAPLAALASLVAHLPAVPTLCLPLDPAEYGGAVWAVPLWSERGLVGLFLLGAKRDGGLYSQEEIEIARASGERLLDTQASAEMARRLMALQRQRLAESQVLDLEPRRVLHDDILPRLHTAILGLSGGPSPDAIALLADIHRRLSDLLHALPASTLPEVSRLGLAGALRQVVDGELQGAFDGVTWEVAADGQSELASLPPHAAEVLFYAAREAMRNAAHHGRGGDVARPLHLRVAVACRNGLEIIVEDDGVGLGPTGQTEDAGGQGLALHSTMMAVIGGSLAVESQPGAYTRVALALPRQRR